MNKTIKSSLLMLITGIIAFAFTADHSKLTTGKSHIRFFSTTPAEDIEAHNYKSIGTFDMISGDVVFSVPMQGFEFKKALMQKHFNQEKFLDTKNYPKSKLVGKVTNVKELTLTKDGVYRAQINGELSIKDKTNPIHEQATISVKGKVISVRSTFNIKLADYGIVFEKGKPSSNVAKTVEITVEAEYVN